MIVADSDVLIDALRGRAEAVDRVAKSLKEGVLATTAVSAFELLSGAREAQEREAVATLLGAMELLPLERRAAERAAEVRRLLESQGQSIGMADYLIAGICLAHSAVLLTRNARHFERVPGLILTEPVGDPSPPDPGDGA